MKIAAGIIVFNSDFVLKQVLESIYPYMNQILISEGTVKYWSDKGITTSTDQTNEIILNFPDPENKIKVIHGTYTEKTEQANAYMSYVDPDTDYIWNIDADEIFKPRDIETIINLLQNEKPSTIAFRSYTFYGGFKHYLTGFEWDHNFIRIQKYYPHARWGNHRPPTIEPPAGVTPIKQHFLTGEDMARLGIYMYHYSYVFPRQVYEKIQYYESAVIKKDGCIVDYFQEVFKKWCMGSDQEKKQIEEKYKGVHEFTPETRGECYTREFKGEHPIVIMRDMLEFKLKLNSQTKKYFYYPF